MILIVNLVLLGVSLFWFITAVTTMPLWQGISLAGGLLPAVASGVMTLLLFFELRDILKRNKINKEYFLNSFSEVNWKDMIPIVVGLCILAGIKLIGMLLTLTIMAKIPFRLLCEKIRHRNELRDAVSVRCI